MLKVSLSSLIIMLSVSCHCNPVGWLLTGGRPALLVWWRSSSRIRVPRLRFFSNVCQCASSRLTRCHPDCAVVVELVAVLRTSGAMTQTLQNQAAGSSPSFFLHVCIESWQWQEYQKNLQLCAGRVMLVSWTLQLGKSGRHSTTAGSTNDTGLMAYDTGLQIWLWIFNFKFPNKSLVFEILLILIDSDFSGTPGSCHLPWPILISVVCGVQNMGCGVNLGISFSDSKPRLETSSAKLPWAGPCCYLSITPPVRWRRMSRMSPMISVNFHKFWISWVLDV